MLPDYIWGFLMALLVLSPAIIAALVRVVTGRNAVAMAVGGILPMILIIVRIMSSRAGRMPISRSGSIIVWGIVIFLEAAVGCAVAAVVGRFVRNV
jgi:hypothetical protein